MPKSAREYSTRNMARIDAFANRNALVKRFLPVLSKEILLLDLVSALPLDPKSAEAYATQHIIAAQRGIGNNCSAIARATRDAGRASGTMSTNHGAHELIGWSNHRINFDLLGDGTTVAVDLTASNSIDWDQGNFDVLCVRATDVMELRSQVGELYGGDWQINA